MSKMMNLSFDDGYKSFTVNGDENRVVYFNPADMEIVNRILNVQKMFDNYEIPEDIDLNPDGTPKSDLEAASTYVTMITSVMRKAFNDIFNSDVYDTIFNGQSPLCIVSNHFLFENVLEALLKIIKPETDAYQKKLQKQMKKYLGDIE